MDKPIKKLVVYYSLEGNTKFIAESIADEIKADIFKLEPVKDIENSGFVKYLLGGSQVMFKKTPQLKTITQDIEDYDIIFIGTPVWAWNFSPPIRTFLSDVKISKKQIALFCCCQGQAGKTFQNMKRFLNNNEILGEKVFIEPLRNDKIQEETKAKAWAREILC